MRNNKNKAILLTLLTLTSMLFGLGGITTNSIINSNIGAEGTLDDENLKTSGLTIYVNDTHVFRLFETVNITVDTSDYLNANYTEIRIPFLNHTFHTYNMTHTGDDLFSFNYTPGEDAPCYLQQLRIQVFQLPRILRNTDYAEINIMPNCLVSYNSSTYYKGDGLSALLGPFNNSNDKFGWNKWNVSIIDDTFKILFNIGGTNKNSFDFVINDSFVRVNEVYYANVSIYDGYQLKGVEYYEFEVRNSKPEILEPTIELTPNPVYRSSTDNCQLTLNVSDLEDNLYPGNISVYMILTYSADIEIVEALSNNYDNSFELDFHVGLNYPVGNYNVNITVIDQHGRRD